jgi:hypothetical protein
MEEFKKDSYTFTVTKDGVIYFLIGVILVLIFVLVYNAIDQLNYNKVSSLEDNTANDVPLENSNPKIDSDFQITEDPNDPSMKNVVIKSLGITFPYLRYAYLESEEYIGPDLNTLVSDPVFTTNSNKISFSGGQLHVFDRDPSLTIEQSIRKVALPTNDPNCRVSRIYPSDEDFFFGPYNGFTFAKIRNVSGKVCTNQFFSNDVSSVFFTIDNISNKLFYITIADNNYPSLRSKNGEPFFIGIQSIN